MNEMPKDSIIVMDMAGDFIKIRVSGVDLINSLKSLGFQLSDEYMVLSVNNESEKIKIINQLISIGALFLYGNGWYPSEVMEYLKEKGIKFDRYKVIFWRDTKTYQIEER
jgi:hypothetical protein